MESKIILFHSDEESKCKKFIEEENSLIISENSKDDIWLGKGMYFWDNKGNANWWKDKQESRNKDKRYSIVIVNAVLDKLLDLTDFEVYMKMEELWQEICKLCNLDSNVPVGKKLNFLFETLNFEEEYDLIKVYGKYNHTPNKGFFKFDYRSMKSEPTMVIKCIYSIRNEECIVEKEIKEE